LGIRGAGLLVAAHGPASPRRLAQGLLAYPIALVVLSLLAYVFSFRPVLGPSGRFAGVLFHPNAWGALVVTLLPWMVPPLVRCLPERRIPQAPLALLVLLAGYTLVLSTSRAALLGAVCAVAIFCLVHCGRRIAAIALLGTVFVTSQSLADPDMWEHLVN